MAIWQPSTILRFVKSFPTSTNVVLVDTDEGEGFLKTLGNPEGPNVLACEWIDTLLADWFGLRTLQHAIIWVTPEDNIPLANGTLALPGPAFITRKLSAFPWGGDQTTLRTLREAEPTIARLVVFDTWIRNCDRHRPAPQPRLNRDNVLLTKVEGGMLDLLAMDHTHAFTCGSPLTKRIGNIDIVQDPTIYGCFEEFVSFLRPSDVAACADRLAEIDLATVAGFISQVPELWQVDAAVRNAWVQFIVDRGHFVASTIATNLWPAIGSARHSR